MSQSERHNNNSSNPTVIKEVVHHNSKDSNLLLLVIQTTTIASYAVNSVNQFLHAPTEDHFLAVKHIFRYIKGTLHFGLSFRPSIVPGALVGYSDADWAGCPDIRHSTSGYSIYAGNNLVSWSARKQPTVSHSSCESEYRALAMTTAELLWLTHLLYDLKVPVPQPPLLLCDNKSAIFLSSNPVSHKRAKHVELDYHFLRELVVVGKLRTQFVPSHLQVADIFTKSVSRPLFEFFRSKLHVCSNPTLRLRGGVEDTVKDISA
ncbi:secreted RxLR effector protein 161-like [Aristolochia californica]|uniref:secreted RxLR effector protein 161-like n=1 Tax=Aristolochia californica TaxID=171875 RepID=UPI0035DB3326